ncbi:MAG: hypothetical protein K9N49_03700 [Candidatus Marinimicrobia bacterium]|nr:hypothetical protein [Candidatus Neomarinimicrobiota bacterium]
MRKQMSWKHGTEAVVAAKKIVGIVIGMTVAFGMAQGLRADDFDWTNTTGVNHEWTNTANWFEGALPGAADTVYFRNEATYAVHKADGLVDSVYVVKDAVTLTGNDTVDDDRGVPLVVTSRFVIGTEAGETASLKLDQYKGLAVTNSGGTAEFKVGEAGTGSFDLNDGPVRPYPRGGLLVDHFIATNVAAMTLGQGNLTIKQGSTIDMNLAMSPLGGFNYMQVTLLAGTHDWTVDGLYLGSSAGSNGRLLVTGSGTVLNLDADAHIRTRAGSGGRHSQLNVTAGATMNVTGDVDVTSRGALTDQFSTLNIEDSDSTLNVAGSLTLGAWTAFDTPGTNRILIGNGALANVQGDVVVGVTANAGSDNTLWVQSGGTLRVTNTVTGGTIEVRRGLLAVDGLVDADALTVETNGLLSGTGQIQAPITIVGELSPGNSIGTLTVEGTVTLASDGVFKVELGASDTSDRLAITDGYLNLSSGGILSLVGTLDGSYTLATFDTQTESYGTFSSVELNGSTEDFATSGYAVTYGSDSITLAIPEPGVLTLLAMGVGLLFLRRRC